MTISSETRRNDYTGTGGTATYAYSFLVRAEADLEVKKTDTAGTVTTLVLTTDYTVSSVGLATGGNIVLTSNLELNYTLSIVGKKSPIQSTSIRDEGTFYGSVHENEFDNRAIIDLEQKEELGRCVKLPSSIPSTSFDPTFPSDLLVNGADAVPLINSGGTAWDVASAWPTGAAISAAAANAAAAAVSAAASAAAAGTLSPYGINNLGLSTSVGSSALTIALKQADGATDPASGTGGVIVYFRHATATDGSMTGVTSIAALSIVVPSGATLGHNDALADYIYIYAINNAGTMELAVSSSDHWDEGQTLNTTAIGTGSDDGATMYSTSARTGVAIRKIGRLLSTQTTAGTWDAAITRVEVGFAEDRGDKVFARSAAFTLKSGIFYNVDTTSGALNLQLPTPSSGFLSYICDATGQFATNNATLVRAASEDINAVAASYVLDINNYVHRITSDGTDWFVSNNKPVSKYAMFGFTAAANTIPTAYASITFGSDISVATHAGVSRSSNVFTFTKAGQYRVTFQCPEIQANTTKEWVEFRLRNTTDSTDAGFTNIALVANFESSIGHNVPVSRSFLIDIDSGDVSAADAHELQWKTNPGTNTVFIEQDGVVEFEYLGTT